MYHVSAARAQMTVFCIMSNAKVGKSLVVPQVRTLQLAKATKMPRAIGLTPDLSGLSTLS